MTDRCADCRHWQARMKRATRITDTRWDEALGRYIFTEEAYEYPEAVENPGWRICMREKQTWALMAVVIPHETGDLETAPEYGCVLWEERTDA